MQDPLENALRAAFGDGAQTEPDPLDSAALPDAVSQWPAQPDRYELQEEIARGGFGVVMRARDRKLGREVAVKLLKPGLEERVELQRRLITEARISSQLQHPCVVPVYDYGLLAPGRPYIAMKLIEGETLDARLTRHGTREPGQLLSIFERVCQAAAYAHSRRVIHRDLKPSNVMVGRFGEVQVMDWGLAKVLDTDSDSESGLPAVSPSFGCETPPVMSVPGMVMGTPAYMSPEQAQGGTTELDVRSDVFCLGAILFEILTAERLHLGSTVEEVRARARSPDPDAARRRLESSVSDPELIELTCSCLDRDPALRPAHAGELATRVSHHLASVEERARAADLAAAEARAHAAEERRARRLVLGLAATIMGALLLAGGGYVWWRTDLERRRADARERLAAPWTRARALWVEAQRTASLEASLWDRAGAAVREAHAAAEAGQLDAGLQQQVRELAEDIEIASQAAARARRFRDRLQDIQAWLGDQHRQAGAFEEAFAHHGLSVSTASDSEIVAAVSKSPLRENLIRALETWGGLRRSTDSEQGEGERLLAIAAAADPDPLRSEIRRAFRGRDRDALRTLATRIDGQVLPVATLLTLSDNLGRLGDQGAARQVLQRAIEQHPRAFWLRFQLGLWSYRSGQFADAVRGYEAATVIRPESYAAWSNLGNALDASGGGEEALRAHRRALDLGESHPELWNNHGATLHRVGRYQEAITAYERALELDGALANAAANIGYARKALGQAQEAREAWLRSARLGSRDVAVYLELGNQDRREGRLEEACDHWRRGLALDPDHVPTLTNLGWTVHILGDSDEAVTLLRRAIEQEADRPYAWLNLGAILERQARFDEAEEVYASGLRSQPGDPHLLEAHGQALMRLGRFEEAEPRLARALAGREGSAGTHEAMGRCLYDRGAYRTAVDHLDLALRLNGGEVTEDLRELRMAARALAARQATLASRLLTGLPREAPEELALLARVCRAVGDQGTAVALWRRALGPDLGDATPSDLLEAARSAVARSVTSSGEEAGSYRRQAMAWLESAFHTWEAVMEGDVRRRRRVPASLHRSLHAPELEPVRGASALARLPAAEAEAWTALWKRARGLLD